MQLMVLQELVARKRKGNTITRSRRPPKLLNETVGPTAIWCTSHSRDFDMSQQNVEEHMFFRGAWFLECYINSWCYVPAQSKKIATSETDSCLFGLSYLILQIYFMQILYHVGVSQTRQKLI